MKIVLQCPDCHRGWFVGKEKAGRTTKCPYCDELVYVWPSVPRRSGWSVLLFAIGIFSLIVGLLVCLFDPVVGFLGLVVGFQSLVGSFLIDVFTDIRWFLKQLVDQNTKPKEESKDE